MEELDTLMLALTNMGGVAPKLTPTLLPDTAAQVATNVVLHNGGVRALKSPQTVVTPTKSAPFRTIFRYGNVPGETQYWLTWPNPVHVARGPVPGDTEEKIYFTGDGSPKKTCFSLALQGGTSYPMAAFEMGVPPPVTAPLLQNVFGTGPATEETRVYVYTHVSVWGEESSPSPPASGIVKADSILRVHGFSTPPSGALHLVARRIYRTVTASSGVNYYFVAEIPVSASEFVDNVSTSAVGEPLPSLDWDLPPTDLSGLIALPSGALCGFSGKQVCFSVVGAPYAWPQKYRLTGDYEIVALAPMGQNVVVLTQGYPYVINAGDPEASQMAKVDEEQACISARSVVPFRGGVLYASPDGLVHITPSGVSVLTKNIIDREGWQALSPQGLFAARFDGRYYGFLSSGGFVLDESGNFTWHDVRADAAWQDPMSGQLYVSTGQFIQKWDAASEKTATWRSKRFLLARPENFAAAQLKANSYGDLSFRLRAVMDSEAQAQAVAQASRGLLQAEQNVLTYQTRVLSDNPFRLPGGFMSKCYEIEIVGKDHWTACFVAGSMEELSRV